MHALGIIFGLFLLAFILWGAFENAILPRHVVRKVSLRAHPLVLGVAGLALLRAR